MKNSRPKISARASSRPHIANITNFVKEGISSNKLLSFMNQRAQNPKISLVQELSVAWLHFQIKQTLISKLNFISKLSCYRIFDCCCCSCDFQSCIVSCCLGIIACMASFPKQLRAVLQSLFHFKTFVLPDFRLLFSLHIFSIWISF